MAGVGFKALWRMALALPGVCEGTSYGTPAFKVGGKLLARVREDGESLAVMVTFEDREVLLEADPEAFFLTDHYRNYPIVLVRLSKVRAGPLRAVLGHAWRARAPKRVQAAARAAALRPAKRRGRPR